LFMKLVQQLPEKKGYKVLEEASSWGEAIGGNSILVTEEWLEGEQSSEIVQRFMKASAEGLSILHNDKDLSLNLLTKWYGIKDRDLLEMIYEKVKWLVKKPYPCVEGIRMTMKLYDSHSMRQYSATDFYDDRYVKELDDRGFLDSLYNN